jgi:hypothetical protein
MAENMTAIESVKKELLIEATDDHVGLWSVIHDVENAFPKKGQAAVRNEVLALLYELLIAGEIIAGFPTADGDFVRFDKSPDEVLDQIKTDWPLGTVPSIGEGLWFTKANQFNKGSLKMEKDALISYLTEGNHLVDILRRGESGGKTGPSIWLYLQPSGGISYTFEKRENAVGGHKPPRGVLHENKIFEPKKSEVAAYLQTFGLSESEAMRVIRQVGTAS